MDQIRKATEKRDRALHRVDELQAVVEDLKVKRARKE